MPIEDKSPEAFEGFIQVQKSNRVRCLRIGLSDKEIAVAEILLGLPEAEPQDAKWLKWTQTPGIIWIAGRSLAKWLYGSASETHVRETNRILASLQTRGYLPLESAAEDGRSKRYKISRLRDWMASVDVTDIYKKAAPPVALPAGCPAAPAQRAPKKVVAKKASIKLAA